MFGGVLAGIAVLGVIVLAARRRLRWSGRPLARLAPWAAGRPGSWGSGPPPLPPRAQSEASPVVREPWDPRRPAP